MAYRLDWSDVLREQLYELYAQADAAGQLVPFRDGVRYLFHRMKHEPHNLGEIRYHTGLGAPVHVAASAPLVIAFVIFESLQAVCILQVSRLAGPGE